MAGKNGRNGSGNGQLHVVQGSLKVAGADYVTAHDLRGVADQLIKDEEPAFGHLRNFNLAFLFRKGTPTGMKNEDGEVQIHTIAKAFKTSPLWESLTGFHAGVWIWEWWWDRFEPTKRAALTMHELCHLGEEKGVVKIQKHDLEDFAMVAGRYGAWMEGVQLYARQLELFETGAAK